jgi:hypothetical protein
MKRHLSEIIPRGAFSRVESDGNAGEGRDRVLEEFRERNCV